MQSIALDVLYQNIHHMYLMIMNIATPIPKNVLDDLALCRHDPPKHGTKASALICYYLDLIVSAIDSP